MAEIKDGNIIFSTEEEIIAWNNSIGLIDIKDDSKKMCYICKYEMDKENKYSSTNKDNGWVVDIINLKKINKGIDSNNIIAVHFNCFSNIERPKKDMKKNIDSVKSYLWKSRRDEK